MENPNGTDEGGDLLLADNGFHKGTRRTVDLLYTNQHILKESKMKRKNISMIKSDNKKAYDVVPKS